MPRSSPTPDEPQILAAVSLAGVTYQRKMIQCGKPRCRRWHGPYWYAFWKSDGSTKCKYIGKRLPREVAQQLELDQVDAGQRPRRRRLRR